jgi:putative transposase
MIRKRPSTVEVLLNAGLLSAVAASLCEARLGAQYSVALSYACPSAAHRAAATDEEVPPGSTATCTNIPQQSCFFRNSLHLSPRSAAANAAVNARFIQFGKHAYINYNIAVGRYVIMPDHVHLFVRGPDDSKLGRWMGTLKQFLAKAVARKKRPKPLWQRQFFDHVLRSDESYGQKWNYVRDNPVRAGLVAKAEDWPYAGEIIPIDRI